MVLANKFPAPRSSWEKNSRRNRTLSLVWVPERKCYKISENSAQNLSPSMTHFDNRSVFPEGTLYPVEAGNIHWSLILFKRDNTAVLPLDGSVPAQHNVTCFDITFYGRNVQCPRAETNLSRFARYSYYPGTCSSSNNIPENDCPSQGLLLQNYN